MKTKNCKRLVLCLLAFALAFALIGCAGNAAGGPGAGSSSSSPASSGSAAGTEGGAESESAASAKPSGSPMVHIEEQELYNANNIVVTVPEQTINPSVYPTLRLACQYDHSLFFSYLDLKVDGEIYQKGSHSNADGQIDPAGPNDEPIPVDFWAAVDAGRDSGEITFVLDLWDDILTSIDTAEVTIPYTITNE